MKRAKPFGFALPISYGGKLRLGGGSFFFPSALGRLGDEPLLEGACGDAHIADFAIGQQSLHALYIREEAAFGDRRYVRTNTASFLGFTRTPDDAALDGAFTG